MSAAFAYRAAHRSGVMERGTLRADTAEAARAALAARGLFPLELRAEEGNARGRRRMAPDDLAVGLRVLADLLGAGLPLARALAALEELAPPAWKAAVPALRAAVREGSTLAAALNAAPVELPPLVVGLVAAGEAGSGLAPALAKAAALAERAAETRGAVRSALAYPLLLAGAGAASIVLLVGFVLPRFAAILRDLGQQLPATARLVLSVADAARAGWVPAGVTIAIALVVWRAWAASAEGRPQWHALLLALPVVGPIRRSAATARFAAALSALLESGVPIAPALGHAVRAAGDAALSARILAARQAVLGGQGLAAALERADAATPTAIRLVRAGEETGRLAEMLEQAARLEAARAENAIRGAVKGIEPALILVFGAIVALVAAALLQSVYSVRPVP
ncbi:MAG: type II secretion system F family protein [Longimicrobiaceae bacterium]